MTMTECRFSKSVRQTGPSRFALSTMRQTGLARQGGFTLVELLVSVSIMTAVVTGLSAVVFRAFRDVPFQRSGLSSLDESRRVLVSVSRDLQVATATNLINGASPVPSVTITAKAPGTALTHTTVYSRSGNNLVRTLDGVPGIVGRNITAAGFSVSGSGALFTVTLTSTTDNNATSAVTSAWNVYKRTGP